MKVAVARLSVVGGSVEEPPAVPARTFPVTNWQEIINILIAARDNNALNLLGFVLFILLHGIQGFDHGHPSPGNAAKGICALSLQLVCDRPEKGSGLQKRKNNFSYIRIKAIQCLP